jgi:hypothetical protein
MLEYLSLETLSSQILDFEGKARANPIEQQRITTVLSCHRCLINTDVEK